MINNKNLQGLCLLALILILNSCTVTTVFKSREKSMSRQAEVNGTSTVLLNKPIVADLDVSMTRQTVTTVSTNLEMDNSTMELQPKGNSTITQHSVLNYYRVEAKNRAQFEFMKQFECDYLVDPIYTIDVTSQSNSETITYSVELSAFPAKYSKFSQPDSLPKSIVQVPRTTLIDDRSLPLFVAQKRNVRVAGVKENGWIFGLGLSKEIDAMPSDNSVLSYNLGLYRSSGVSKPVGFRTELKLVGYGGKSNVNYDLQDVEIKTKINSIALPLMLSFNIKKVSVLFGVIPAVNVSYKVVSKPSGYSSGYSDVGVDEGLTFGLNYRVTDKFSVGYRLEQFAISGFTSQGLSLSVKFK
jgi:hypothetical protein